MITNKIKMLGVALCRRKCNAQINNKDWREQIMDIVVYTVKEIAGIIHTNTTYVYELIKKGYLPALKLGCYKVRAESLQKFLIENEGKDLTDLDNVTNLSVGNLGG